MFAAWWGRTKSLRKAHAQHETITERMYPTLGVVGVVFFVTPHAWRRRSQERSTYERETSKN